MATSSTEAEYVAAASCCAQVLWIQNQLLDIGFKPEHHMHCEEPSILLLGCTSSAVWMVSAGRTMVLLVVILPAGCFVSDGSYGLCCWFRVHAGGHTSAGGFISADRVYVPAVCMVSAVG
ncbi:hypothetical protein Tco_0751335 [Tanacetum coccineum]|uniref:Uncharacterized protein n=1 Tax=Tanacetum coccineum TaxID=301880 RepID=A0ABQ4Z3R8_9ASTR